MNERYHTWTHESDACVACGLPTRTFDAESRRYSRRCFPLDLSPLAKFVKPLPADYSARRVNWGLMRRVAEDWNRHKRHAEQSRMYGWPFDPTEPETPKPIPEKSPQDKALDEFIAKRKDKRGHPGEPQPAHAHYYLQDGCKECDAIRADRARAKALSDAMSKLSPHETSHQERLSPYRGPNV